MYGRTQRLHFIGIGGAGMSGIAEVLLTMGYQVSGSDLKAGEVTDRLIRLGGRVFIGHQASNVEGAQVVVFSSAVRTDNEELRAAQAAGVPVIARAEMLAELMRMKYGVAVAGAHGKTTTTSLVSAVLARGGLDPTVVVGGRWRALGSHARLGHGEFLVAEADESDGSFLHLSPAIGVVTNIDREHLDHYGDFEKLLEAFVDFANRVPFYGVAVLCGDDRHVQHILPSVTKRTLLYGTGPESEVRAERIEMLPLGSRFTLVWGDRELGRVEFQVPGRHNVLNALAAAAVGLELDVGIGHIREALASFHGVARRFENRGEAGGVQVVDDYAHHPTEILATLSAARGLDKRILLVFQPHRYSRTAALREEFGAALGKADRVWVTEVYAAGEAALPGVSGADLVESARRQGARHVEFAPDFDALIEAVAAAAQPGDLVLTLGAGDVWKLGDRVLERLGAQPSSARGAR